MQSLVDRYLQGASYKLSAASIKTMRPPLTQFARWWDVQRRSPANLSVNDMYLFLTNTDGLQLSLRGAAVGHVSNASYNRKMDTVRVFVQWLVDTRAVKDSAVLVQFKHARRKPGEVSLKVRLSMTHIMDAVTSCPTPYDRWVTAFAFLSMGREAELLNTRMHHFDLDNNRINWARPKVGDYDDNLPMTAQLVKEYRLWREAYLELCPLLNGDSYAIPKRLIIAQGKVHTYDPTRRPRNVGHIIKTSAARSLGVPPSSLKNQAGHIARRSGARALYDQLRDAGVEDPIRIVMTMLGHTVQATTEHYIGVRDDRERRDIVLAGSDLMNFEEGNVIQLHEAR